MAQVRSRACFRQAEGVEAREVGDELFLALPELGTIHHLNRMARAAWHALETPRSAAELIALFEHAFPATPKRQIAKDIAKLMQFFEDNKLVVLVREDVRPRSGRR